MLKQVGKPPASPADTATKAYIDALFARVQVTDANYQILVTDVLIIVTKLTAARTITLPLSTSLVAPYPPLRILDASGSCSAINTLTIQPFSAADSIASGNPVLASAYAWIDVILASSGLWIFR